MFECEEEDRKVGMAKRVVTRSEADFPESGGGDEACETVIVEAPDVTVTMTLVVGSFTYDGQPHAATAVVTVSGRRMRDNVTPDIAYALVVGGATTPLVGGALPTDAGTYSATATYGDLTVTGTLTICPAPLVVVAPNVTVPYGVTLSALATEASTLGSPLAPTVSASPDDITATAALFASGGGPALVDGRVPVAKYTGAITAVLSTTVLGNYTPDYTPGTLTVTKAPLLVVAPSVTVPSGETLDDLDSALATAPAPTVSDNPDGIVATATLAPSVPIPTQPATYANAVIPVLSANATTAVLDNYCVVTPSSAPSGTHGTPGTLTVTAVASADARETELLRRMSSDLDSAQGLAARLNQGVAQLKGEFAQFNIHHNLDVPSGSQITGAEIRGGNTTPSGAASAQKPKLEEIVIDVSEARNEAEIVVKAIGQDGKVLGVYQPEHGMVRYLATPEEDVVFEIWASTLLIERWSPSQAR
jgi:hypothetical protein